MKLGFSSWSRFYAISAIIIVIVIVMIVIINVLIIIIVVFIVIIIIIIIIIITIIIVILSIIIIIIIIIIIVIINIITIIIIIIILGSGRMLRIKTICGSGSQHCQQTALSTERKWQPACWLPHFPHARKSSQILLFPLSNAASRTTVTSYECIFRWVTSLT
jgi:energy-coupling factor transporter transmembrane protein EcfT